MIDTFKETILSVNDAAKHVGEVTGKKRNRAVIMRWANRGVSGVRLRTILIGGEVFTSSEALNEFFADSRRAKQKRRSDATAGGIRATAHTTQQANLESEASLLGI